MKLTGVEFVDVVKALHIRRIMRTGPKRTRQKRVRNFVKEFNKN